MSIKHSNIKCYAGKFNNTDRNSCALNQSINQSIKTHFIYRMK